MLFNLKHPGIVSLYSTFSTPEKLYFVMEYLEGGDLAEFIRLN
jgi:serine/threonine protein kinase